MGLIRNKLRKRMFFLLLIVFLLFFTGCQTSKATSSTSSSREIDKKNITSYIDQLSSEKYDGRKTGSQGEAEAALYLATYLKSLGIAPYQEASYFHDFSDPLTGIKGDNVLGILKNPERHKYIILSANYDHLGRDEKNKNALYPGANQNASGVSAVMELARIFSENFNVLDYNIVFAFWSGHEQNLLGSKNYVESLSKYEKNNIAFLVNLDTIGSYGSNNYIIWRENDLASKYMDEIISWKDFSISLSARGIDNSDHYYFALEDIPAFTIRSENWEDGIASTSDSRYGVSIDNVRKLSQNLFDYISKMEDKDDD